MEFAKKLEEELNDASDQNDSDQDDDAMLLVWKCPDCKDALMHLDQTCSNCRLSIHYFEDTKKVGLESMLLEVSKRALIDN